jgi:ribosome-binding factor A
MPTRRQEKVAHVVQRAVSNAILSHLSDPRIEGVVSVTRVEMSPDLRTADVYLSVLGKNEKSQHRTFIAIEHAKRHVQSFVADAVKIKFCPVLHFHEDEKFKKTLETMNLIDLAASEYQDTEQDQDDQWSCEATEAGD